jgi:hypothetical protein
MSAAKNKRLIAAVRDYAAAESEPTKHGYMQYAQRHGGPSIEELYTVFGSWRGVCDAAKLTKPRGAPPLGTKKAAIASLKRCYGDKGCIFTKREYAKWAQSQAKTVSLTSILRLFGCWKVAMQEAGLAVTRERRLEAGPELEALIKQICDGRPLSVREWNEQRPDGAPSARSIALAYDGSWPAALEAAGEQPIYPAKKPLYV